MGAALGFPHTCFLPQCSELTVPSVFQVKQDGPLLGCKDRKPLKCCVLSQRCLIHPGLECHVGPTRISTRQVLLCSMLLGSGSSNPDGVLGQAGGAAVVLCARHLPVWNLWGTGTFPKDNTHQPVSASAAADSTPIKMGKKDITGRNTWIGSFQPHLLAHINI